MSNTEALILKAVRERAGAIGFPENEVNLKTDLIRSGLYDSMSFIDLVVALEEACGVEIDLEKIQPAQISTPAKLKEMITSLRNA